MRKNKAFLIETFGVDQGLTLNAMVEDEMSRQVIRLNGENNKKELAKHNYPKDSWEWTYNSTGRNLVRMWWLTKFLTALLDNLINRGEMTLVAACRDAY